MARDLLRADPDDMEVPLLAECVRNSKRQIATEEESGMGRTRARRLFQPGMLFRKHVRFGSAPTRTGICVIGV